MRPMRRSPSGGVCTDNSDCGAETPNCCPNDDGSGNTCVKDVCPISGECLGPSDCPQPESQVCCNNRCYDGDCCDAGDCDFSPCVCCDFTQVLGECCEDDDCSGNQQCVNNNCQDPAVVTCIVSFGEKTGSHNHLLEHIHEDENCSGTNFTANERVSCDTNEVNHSHSVPNTNTVTDSHLHIHDCASNNHDHNCSNGKCGTPISASEVESVSHTHNVTYTDGEGIGCAAIMSDFTTPPNDAEHAHASVSASHSHTGGCDVSRSGISANSSFNHSHPDLCFDDQGNTMDCE